MLDPDQYGMAFRYAHFINYGRDNEGARDSYVYAVWAGEKVHPNAGSSSLYLTRVPSTSVGLFEEYEFYAGRDESGDLIWSGNIDERVPVLACDRCIAWAVSAVYVPPLQKYVLITNAHSASEDYPASSQTDLEFWQADEPWGPWTLAKRFVDWRPPGATASQRHTFFFEIPVKWISESGHDFTLIFTGKGIFDAWNSVRGRFSVSSEADSDAYMRNR